jgi:signal transduction histidine kinase
VLTGNSRVPVELTLEGAAELPADMKIAVYRIAQEAFNNIVKHASATQVWVTLRAGDDQLALSVRDDGRGFDSATTPDDHMGLRIMAERAASIGARLRIDSAPGRGTEVALSWPAA